MHAKKAAVQEEAELGEVSASGEVAQLKDLLDAEWALQQDYYEKKLAAAINDARTREKLDEEEALAYEKYLTAKDKLDAQAVQDSQKQWQSLLQPIQRALDTSITGIILGTTTVQKALSNLAQSIIAEFVNSAVQSVFGGLGKFLGASLTGGGGSSNGGSGGQDFWGGITGAGEDIVGGGISQGLLGSNGLLGALRVRQPGVPVVASSVAYSRASALCSGSNTAVLFPRRRAVGWCRRLRSRCCMRTKWCCPPISVKAFSQ